MHAEGSTVRRGERTEGRAEQKGAMGEAMTESGGDARENVRDER